jgi:hypothetical protein
MKKAEKWVPPSSKESEVVEAIRDDRDGGERDREREEWNHAT